MNRAAPNSTTSARNTGTNDTTVAVSPVRFAEVMTSCVSGIPTPIIKMIRRMSPMTPPTCPFRFFILVTSTENGVCHVINYELLC